MTRFVLVLFFCPLISFGQIRLTKLIIKHKEKYELKGDILVVDTLIMMDSSSIILNKLKQDNFIHAKVAIFHTGSIIEGKGVHGIAGRNGKPGVSQQSPCTNGGTGIPGTDGTHGGNGVNLSIYVNDFVFKGPLSIDVSGGDAGDGGVGGSGGGGGRGVLPCVGGSGGQGGSGGNGGNGGKAGNVTFVSPRILEIRSSLGGNITVRNYGGNLGLGGMGGALGLAGLSPVGNTKMDGKPGRKGAKGKDGLQGNPGSINFQEK